jgi:hypothetical protein
MERAKKYNKPILLDISNYRRNWRYTHLSESTPPLFIMNNRHDFTKQTKEIVAKRVGYTCSNPECNRHTIGPNANPKKATLIGEAAHITAASPNGPRFDETLRPEDRMHIDNAIWLCCNCATLIDKDQERYTVGLVRKWKEDSENRILQNLLGNNSVVTAGATPFLEADLIWARASRRNTGYSNKNPIVFEDGQWVMPINISKRLPIIHWEIRWYFDFIIHNNSQCPAYNVKVEEIGDIRLASISRLNNINNLPPFQSLDLETEHVFLIEGVHTEADEILRQRIPKALEGVKLKISYQDDQRNMHCTIVELYENKIVNKKFKG